MLTVDATPTMPAEASSSPIRALTSGDRVRFATPTREAGRWWTVRAGDEHYSVLTRKRELWAASEIVYTIIDRRQGVRGQCNLTGPGWDVEVPGGCDALLRALQRTDEQREHVADVAGRASRFGERNLELSDETIPVEISDFRPGLRVVQPKAARAS
ncbi:hypothetical protein ACQFYA_20935 [Promicromonospora sp. Marseille-Q5078]